MPNTLSADLHSMVFSQSGDHQQMMCRLFAGFNCKSYPFKVFRLHLNLLEGSTFTLQMLTIPCNDTQAQSSVNHKGFITLHLKFHEHKDLIMCCENVTAMV